MYSPVPIKRSSRYGNNYWEAYSPKLKRNIRLFSDLEYDHWVLIETNPKVKCYCEQPIKIQQLYEGRYLESILDMWVVFEDDDECFIEVKYSQDLDPTRKQSVRSLKQTAIQRLWCEERGLRHIIQTEKEIRQNPIYLSNMKQILGYLRNRQHPIDTDQHRILQFIHSDKLCISTIEQSLPLPREIGISRSFYLLSKLSK